MPKEGYKCITVYEEVYTALAKHYAVNAPAYRKQGINSMSALATKILWRELDK